MKKHNKKQHPNTIYSLSAEPNAAPKKHTIDAKGKKLGRVATEAASILMGKNTALFVRHKAPDVKVVIVNASKLSISEKHRENDKFARFSGYQGGLRFDTLSQVIAKHGYQWVVKHAVRGMIPATKLRPEMLKKLEITD